MTDPIYGDHPFDVDDAWKSALGTPLTLDPEWQVWGGIITTMAEEYLQSQWLMRWRRALATAEGVQLEEWGEILEYLRPDGWTDERWRAVLEALLPAALFRATPEIVGNLALALLDVGQSFTHAEEFPCSDRFTFLETDADDAVAYLTALNRARPQGCQYFLVAHPGGGGTPFVIGTSTINGPDTLAELFYQQP